MPYGQKRVFQTALTDVSTSDLEGVGTIRREGDNEYVYAKGVASTVAGSPVVINEAYATALITKALADVPQPRIGLAMGAIVASRWGWYQIRGQGSVWAAATVSADVALYSSGTAGELDDASGSQTKIFGIRLDTANTGTARATACTLMYPYTV